MTPHCGTGILNRAAEFCSGDYRTRTGGERLQRDAGHPRRTVKNLLQEAVIPAWERSRLPLIYCGDTLVCIPGVGIDHRYRAAPGEPAIAPEWQLF